LHSRARTESSAARREPVPVSAATFESQGSYQREISFLGLVKAGRVSELGFEVPGTVAGQLVREGSAVSAGDVLATLDTAQLEARRAATAADQERVRAELELAKIKAKRQRDLQQSGAVSEEAFDETRLRARALEAQLDSVQARLRGIDIDLEKSVLRAPYDGAVAERLVDSGAVVNPGAPVVRLVASGAREAHIGIAAEQTALLEAGEFYALSLRGRALRARLRSIRPDVDPVTLTTTAVFELPADAGGLDGEPVSLVLEEEVDMRGGWLPMSALLEGERGLWTVLRLDRTEAGVIAVREAVEVLAVHGDRVYVRGTLGDRQRYVADGVHRVAPGTPVIPLEV
jgi:RND family efflux transporter MFP subunit